MNTQLKTPRWCVYWCKMCEIWDQCIESSVQCLNLWKNLIKSSVQCLKVLEWIYQTQYEMCKNKFGKIFKTDYKCIKIWDEFIKTV